MTRQQTRRQIWSRLGKRVNKLFNQSASITTHLSITTRHNHHSHLPTLDFLETSRRKIRILPHFDGKFEWLSYTSDQSRNDLVGAAAQFNRARRARSRCVFTTDTLGISIRLGG